MTQPRDSEDLRAALLRIDRQIAKLVDERAGLLHHPPVQGASIPPRDPTTTARDDERPAPRLVQPRAVDRVLEAVRRACAEVGEPIRVAFPAAWGGEAWAAAAARWGERARPIESASIDAALDAVQRGHVDGALLPFLVADEGYHRPSLRALAHAEARITECVSAPASRDAMALADVGSLPHTVFVAQADRPRVAEWLVSASVRVVEVSSSEEACGLASRDRGTCAVATPSHGERHGLVSHVVGVASDPTRRVHLALVGGRPPSRTGRDHVAVVLTPHEGPGALAEVLRILADERLNVAAIESMRIAAEAEDAHVFLVIEGHVTDRGIVLAFERLRKLVRGLKLIGGYAALG